jgi:hypothetical protein
MFWNFWQASVPNWLKEEIKKAVITTSVEHPRDETQSIEDEGIDKSFGKADQADSKSIDSSRSTEEEDDDEVLFCLFYLVILHCLFMLKKILFGLLLPPWCCFSSHKRVLLFNCRMNLYSYKL